MIIDAKGLDYKQLNDKVRQQEEDCILYNCLGQRFIAAGSANQYIQIHGVPGNALGAYMDGSTVEVFGNAQDAVGDTMNDGTIIVHGNIGDAAGYAMRGGQIYIQENAGYRVGIHMKAYQEKYPVIVIGGRVGSFLGEYQAGGLIIVLGLHDDGRPVISNYSCNGMYGGKVIIRRPMDEVHISGRVKMAPASQEDVDAIRGYIDNFCQYFNFNDIEMLYNSEYTVIVPDSANPYKQMYCNN